MPSINFNMIGSTCLTASEIFEGLSFAKNAIQFTALGLIAKQADWELPRVHLFALAIELAFKSLAVRSGATIYECSKAGHEITKVMALIEGKGTCIPDRLKTRLGNDEWFKTFLLLSRYPKMPRENTFLEDTIFLHSDYPEMIAAILEVPCKYPLTFKCGSAMNEITEIFQKKN